MRRLAIVFAAFLLAGCVSTSIQGYADRELPTARVRHIAAYVAAPGPLAISMRSTIIEEARKRGVAAEDALVILPPTRQYSDIEIRKVLADRGVDGVLVINVADSGVTAQYAGTLFQSNYVGSSTYDGTISRIGNSGTVSLSGNHTGQSFGTATPTYRYSRRTAFTARLIDPKTARNLWVGNGEVNAGGGGGIIGRLMVADGVSSSNSIGAIFEDLQKTRSYWPRRRRLTTRAAAYGSLS